MDVNARLDRLEQLLIKAGLASLDPGSLELTPGCRLNLQCPDGSASASLEVSESGPCLSLHGKDGAPRILLQVNSDGSTALFMFGQNEKAHLMLSCGDKDGAPSIRVVASDGSTIWETPAGTRDRARRSPARKKPSNKSSRSTR